MQAPHAGYPASCGRHLIYFLYIVDSRVSCSLGRDRWVNSSREIRDRQRNARRRPSQPKEDWVEGFVLVVLRRRRVLVLRLVALAMAFKNVRNLLLINHNDGFIDDDEFVVLYDLFASKNLDFPYDSYARFDLEELDESESFAEFRFGKRDIRILKEVCKSLT